MRLRGQPRGIFVETLCFQTWFSIRMLVGGLVLGYVCSAVCCVNVCTRVDRFLCFSRRVATLPATRNGRGMKIGRDRGSPGVGWRTVVVPQGSTRYRPRRAVQAQDQPKALGGGCDGRRNVGRWWRLEWKFVGRISDLLQFI